VHAEEVALTAKDGGIIVSEFAKVRGGLPVKSAMVLVIVSVGPPARW